MKQPKCIRTVKIKTGAFPNGNAHNPKTLFRLLKNTRFQSVIYNWDDSNPDEVTWEHFLEVELAKQLRIKKIPWPKVIRCLHSVDLKKKELKMAIFVPNQFFLGILSWK